MSFNNMTAHVFRQACPARAGSLRAVVLATLDERLRAESSSAN
jgi:hypothetical protein